MKIKVIRRVGSKIITRFSGSTRVFEIWKQAHELRNPLQARTFAPQAPLITGRAVLEAYARGHDIILKEPVFGSRGTVSRALLPRIEGADTRSGHSTLNHLIFGCHTSRCGEGY